MSNHRDQCLLPYEAAELLEMPVQDVLTAAREGQLPAARIGDHFRFSRLRILDHQQKQA